MKRIILLSVLAIITSFSYAQSATNGKMPETVSEIVSYPLNLELNKQNNYALVNFSINKLGVIKVNKINASKELKAYVLDKLNGYKLINSNGFCGQNFQYKISFKK